MQHPHRMPSAHNSLRPGSWGWREQPLSLVKPPTPQMDTTSPTVASVSPALAVTMSGLPSACGAIEGVGSVPRCNESRRPFGGLVSKASLSPEVSHTGWHFTDTVDLWPRHTHSKLAWCALLQPTPTSSTNPDTQKPAEFLQMIARQVAPGVHMWSTQPPSSGGTHTQTHTHTYQQNKATPQHQTHTTDPVHHTEI